MKVMILTIALTLTSFTATAGMTEAECQNQAKGVFSLLKMVDDGTMPATEKQKQNLVSAKEHYQKGEYCQARSIILNLNK